MYTQTEMSNLRQLYFILLTEPFDEPKQWGDALRATIHDGGVQATIIADEFQCRPDTVLQWALDKKLLSMREVRKRQRKLAFLILMEVSRSQIWIH